MDQPFNTLITQSSDELYQTVNFYLGFRIRSIVILTRCLRLIEILQNKITYNVDDDSSAMSYNEW